MPCYGMTESVVGSTNSPLGRGPVQGPEGHVSVGTPFAGLRVEAPNGLPSGPISLAGDWLFDGYHTTDGFIASPEGWYDTGDHGFTHGGELYVIGRRGEMATSAGRNIFAEDIEDVVYDAERDKVRACAAFRLEEDGHRFGLMVELSTLPERSPIEASLLATRVRAAVSSALGVRVQPVLVVCSGTIPRTISGKVQRALCREVSADDLGHRLLSRCP
jgi:fatty-acyl-CoA synthase